MRSLRSLLNFSPKSKRRKKHVMIEGLSATSDESIFIDSEGNTSKKDPIKESVLASFYKPEAVVRREMLQAGINSFLANFLKGFKK